MSFTRGKPSAARMKRKYFLPPQAERNSKINCISRDTLENVIFFVLHGTVARDCYRRHSLWKPSLLWGRQRKLSWFSQLIKFLPQASGFFFKWAYRNLLSLTFHRNKPKKRKPSLDKFHFPKHLTAINFNPPSTSFSDEIRRDSAYITRQSLSSLRRFKFQPQNDRREEKKMEKTFPCWFFML